jgi:CheY-like chemotaxis protein
MVVDDSSTVRKMMCLMLEDEFNEVVLAEDGEAAVLIVQTRQAGNVTPLDVNLMDFMMPGKSGPTATKEIRDMGYNGLIIGVTGSSMPDYVQTFMDAGVNKVLIKPVDKSMLRQTLEGKKVYLVAC